MAILGVFGEYYPSNRPRSKEWEQYFPLIFPKVDRFHSSGSSISQIFPNVGDFTTLLPRGSVPLKWLLLFCFPQPIILRAVQRQKHRAHRRAPRLKKNALAAPGPRSYICCCLWKPIPFPRSTDKVYRLAFHASRKHVSPTKIRVSGRSDTWRKTLDFTWDPGGLFRHKSTVPRGERLGFRLNIPELSFFRYQNSCFGIRSTGHGDNFGSRRFVIATKVLRTIKILFNPFWHHKNHGLSEIHEACSWH